MSTDRDVTRVVRSWLEEGVTALPDRVLDSVLDQLPTTPQRRSPWSAWRTRTMNKIIGLGLVAAAVVLLAFVGIQTLGGTAPGGPGQLETPSPTPTATPSATPAGWPPEDQVQNGPLEPGTYTQYEIDGTQRNVRFTVPAGWEWDGWLLRKVGLTDSTLAVIRFTTGDVQVYTDPCQWAGSEPDPPTGRWAADLVADLAAQPMRNATTPTARPADGLGLADIFNGMEVSVTVPEDIDFADCDLGQFRSWGPEQNARFHQAPGQRDLVWAIDFLDIGQAPETYFDSLPRFYPRLVINASSFPGTPADVMSEMDAILESIVTGSWG